MRRLKVYASGNGALSFAWIENGLAAGHVTMTHARRFLSTVEGKRLVANGFQLLKINTLPCLATVFERVNADTLRLNGHDYRYSFVNDDVLFHIDPVSDHNLVINSDGPVVNMNTRAGIRFYLNNEKQILANLIK